MTLTPLLTKYVLNAGEGTLGWLTTSMGVGALVSGLVVAYRARPTQRLLLVSATVFVVMLGAAGVSPWMPFTTVLMFAWAARDSIHDHGEHPPSAHGARAHARAGDGHLRTAFRRDDAYRSVRDGQLAQSIGCPSWC